MSKSKYIISGTILTIFLVTACQTNLLSQEREQKEKQQEHGNPEIPEVPRSTGCRTSNYRSVWVRNQEFIHKNDLWNAIRDSGVSGIPVNLKNVRSVLVGGEEYVHKGDIKAEIRKSGFEGIFPGNPININADKSKKASWFSRGSKKASEKIRQAWDGAETFSCAHPKLAAVLAGSGAVIGSCLAYSTVPGFGPLVDRKAEALKGWLEDTWYEGVMEKGLAPLKSKWEDLQEEGLTWGDVARAGGVFGLGYALKKTNDRFNVTGAAAGGLANFKNYMMPFLQDLRTFTAGKLKAGYLLAKHNPGRTAALFLGFATAFCLKAMYSELTREANDYRALVKKLWASLSEEQIAQLDPALFLELVNQAGESPIILKQTPEFTELLTDEQHDCLDEAIADFQQHAKRIRRAI